VPEQGRVPLKNKQVDVGLSDTLRHVGVHCAGPADTQHKVLHFPFEKRLSSLKFHPCAVGDPRDSLWEGQLFLGLSWFSSVPQDSRQSSCKVTSTNVVSDLDLLRYNVASSGKSFPTFRKNVWPLSS
jgi:hypothetical protein